jgi:ATP-dependent RNA helicase SUPV3L1/SUV3
VRAEAKALSQVERRALKALGVKLTAFSIYLPGVLKPGALAFAQGFVGRAWRPPSDRVSALPDPAPAPVTLAAFGLRAVGRHAVPVEALDRLDDLIRSAPRQGQGALITDQAREELGWSEAEVATILRALGFSPATKPKPGEAIAWRRRVDAPAHPAPVFRPGSPFAALAALTPAPPAPAARRPRRRRKPKAPRAARTGEA